MVGQLHELYDYPIDQGCELVELPRSSYYYRSRKADESQLVKDLKKVAGEYVVYGSRRLSHQMRRKPYSYCINRKRVQQLMRQEGLLRPVKRRKKRTTNSDHPYPRFANLVKLSGTGGADRAGGV